MKRQCCPTIPYKKVTHVIFDLDGTILDTQTLIQEVLTEICTKHEKDFPSQLHNTITGATVEDIAGLLILTLELPLTEDEFVEMYNELMASRCSYVKFMPGAEQLIKHLHDHRVPMAVATSSAADLFMLKIHNYIEFFNLFHHIVCGGSDPEVNAGKPSPDIFLVCASRFKARPSPSECLVIEDAPNGVEGAQKAGMQVVMVPDQEVPYEIWKTATLRLDSLEFMAPELFGLPAMVHQGYPIPKISFTMHYNGEDEKVVEKKNGGEQKKKDSLFDAADLFPDEQLMFSKNINELMKQ